MHHRKLELRQSKERTRQSSGKIKWGGCYPPTGDCILYINGMLNATERKKQCFFCKGGKGKLKKFYAYGYQRKAFVCGKCLKALGLGEVVYLLEKIPLPQNDLNYFTKEGCKT